MEELPGGRVLSQGRVSFKTQQQLLQTDKNVKLFEQRCCSRANANETIATKSKHYHYESLNIPMHAMEFLCRSWSPSASDFLHTFSSSNNQILDFEDHKQSHIEEYEEKAGHKSDVLGEQEGIIVQVNNGKRHTAKSKKKQIWSINGWLKENSLTGLLRWRREKKKEEVRLLTAKIHAALSVAQLAAAIAGFAATNSMEKENNTTNEAVKMSNGVAYASALLASACAEAAESVGARRSHVASAVNSGLATQAPSDIITLTAAAATRQRVLGSVSIHLKHRQLMLSLKKKYLGVLTTSEECKI
ncbi:hypothetical protein MANES_08G165450v8 [Manihot esculenta]|uniref:Uncharacterized protein n=3 Tax=Manihot esculenta TaxID=3983 RepID=A0ACB7HC17_MANES|nr:hypothetical protein MANES_08G165450v8 [Manihot esculenta]KAG8649992.1 hypothetical protein MANES_08G165450v8 [Manihot esculenta]